MIRRRITAAPARMTYAERQAFLLGTLTAKRDSALEQARLYCDLNRKDLAKIRVDVARFAHHLYLDAVRMDRAVSGLLRSVA